MGEHDLHRRVEISDSQGTVASADVTISQESDRTARASLRATAGHLTRGIRASLVDAVLDLPEVQDSRAWRPFPLATARHCTGFGSDARTSGPIQPGQLRSWRQTSDLASPPARCKSQPVITFPAVIAAAGKAPRAASKPAP